MKSARYGVVLLLVLTGVSAHALCGGPLERNSFGRPVDYTDPNQAAEIRIVERFHFTEEVERLESGINDPLPGDIGYTLRHIPNHYRALFAMAEWQRKNPPRTELNYLSADCYFQRALTFKPHDATIYMIYGIHLHKADKLESALSAYKMSAQKNPDDPELDYNLGLLYIDLAQYDKAREHARKAYAKGYPLPGLRNKLQRLGEW